MKGLTPLERPACAVHPDRPADPLRLETVGLAVNTKLRYRFTYDPAARRVILFGYFAFNSELTLPQQKIANS